MKKKIFSLFLCFVLCLSFFPASAFADTTNCITFSSSDSFSISAAHKRNSVNLEYSTNGTLWSTWDGTAVSAVQSGGTYYLYFRGTGNSIVTGEYSNYYGSGYYGWTLNATSGVSCSGNIMTLLDHENPGSASMGEYCFTEMFYGCTSLTSAPSLPAATLSKGCYEGMFNGCTSLTSAPSLPATTLAHTCYTSMFEGCTSLTSAPSLPALTLEPYCYQTMFADCTSLTSAPVLPATTLADRCYLGMFAGCTSLTSAPVLPATTLAPLCYNQMFRGCSNLKLYKTGDGSTWSIPAGASVATNWNVNMFQNTGGDIDVAPVPGTVYYYGTPTYTVTVNNDGNGTASADKASAAENETVTLTATPTTGYHFKEWQSSDVTVSGSSFTMPAKNVTVTAIFEADTPVSHTIIAGANSEMTKGSSTGLSFTSNAPFSNFDSVKVDGNTIAAINYTAEEGSTKITLTPAYLETLSVGSHSIEIVSNDGSASTNFTVKAAAQPPVPPTYKVTFDMGGHGTAPADQTVNEGSKATKPAVDPTAEGWTFGGWYADATFSAAFDFNTAITANTTVYAKWTKNSAAPTDPTNPQTGDNSHMFLWIALLFVSGGALVGTTVYGKKRKRAE